MQPQVDRGSRARWSARAQVIGYEGTTGISTGCHLHFAINDHGIWENPRVYLP